MADSVIEADLRIWPRVSDTPNSMMYAAELLED
jgi:hypothetical protein